MRSSRFTIGLGVFGAVLIFVSACDGPETGQPEKTDKREKQSEIIMAEDSELALLMRQLTAETDAIRSALVAGKEHPLWTRIRDLHTATPTDSASSGPVFEGYASAFIGAVEQLEAADTLHTQYFNAVIDRCMDCHGTFCPGPMKRIRKFYVPQSAGV